MPAARLATLAAAFLAATPEPAVAADTVTGPARVTAADTLVVANARIRLAGWAAPAGEARCGMTPCAEVARERLAALVAAGGPVTCVRTARLGHGVHEGSCRLADGRDPARVLGDEGLLRAEGGR